MKILWVSPRYPLPPDSGAKRATLTLLEEIIPNLKASQQEFELNILCMYDAKEDADKSFDDLDQVTQTSDNATKNLYIQKNKVLFDSNFASYVIEKIKNFNMPFTYTRCVNAVNKSQIKHWAKTQKWDVTVLDGLHAAVMIDIQDARYGQIIYRAHNVEADLWRQMYEKEKNFLKKNILKKEYELCAQYEKKIADMSAFVFTVSDIDSERFNKLGWGKKIMTLPIGMSFRGYPLPFSLNESCKELLFIGRLDWIPNKEGLIWFFDHVWPNIKMII